MIGYIRLMSQVGTIAVILLVVLIIAAVLYLYIQEKKRKERSRKRAEERRKRREEALARMREEEENGTAFKRAMEERNQVKQAEDPKQVSRTKDIDTLTNVRVEDSNIFQTGKHRFSTGKIGVVEPEQERAAAPMAPAPAPAVQPAPAPVVQPAPTVVSEPEVKPASQAVRESEPQITPVAVPEPEVRPAASTAATEAAASAAVPGFVEGPKPTFEVVSDSAKEEVLTEETRRFDFRKWASQLDEEIEVEKPVFVETPSAQEEKETPENELTFEVMSDDFSVAAPVIAEEKAEEVIEEISATPSFVTRAPQPQTAPAAPVKAEPAPAPAPIQQAPVQETPKPAAPRAAESVAVSAPRVSEKAYQVLETVEEDHSAKEKEFDDITDVAPIVREQQAMNKKPDIVDEVLNIPATKPAQTAQPVQAAPAPAAAPVSVPQEEISDEEYDEENEEDYFDPDDPETIRLKKIALRRAERELRMKEKERYAAELAGVEIPETGYDEDDEDYDDEEDDDFDDDETDEEKGGALRVVLWIIAALLSLFCVGAILYLMFGDFISGLRNSQETLQAVMVELPDSIKEPLVWFLM
jgi:Ca2+/Na+ antiporter